MRDHEGRDDWALVLAHRAGDVNAFAELVRRRSGLIAAVCRRYCALHAQDVVDETWYRVLLRIESDDFPRGGQFGTWIGGIARNVLRAKGIRGESKELPDDLAAGGEFDLVDLAADMELHEALHRCLEAIEPRLRDVYRLHFVEELPLVRVASEFGCSEANVRQKLVPKLTRSVGDCLKKKGFRRGSNLGG